MQSCSASFAQEVANLSFDSEIKETFPDGYNTRTSTKTKSTNFTLKDSIQQHANVDPEATLGWSAWSTCNVTIEALSLQALSVDHPRIALDRSGLVAIFFLCVLANWFDREKSCWSNYFWWNFRPQTLLQSRFWWLEHRLCLPWLLRWHLLRNYVTWSSGLVVSRVQQFNLKAHMQYLHCLSVSVCLSVCLFLSLSLSLFLSFSTSL